MHPADVGIDESLATDPSPSSRATPVDHHGSTPGSAPLALGCVLPGWVSSCRGLFAQLGCSFARYGVVASLAMLTWPREDNLVSWMYQQTPDLASRRSPSDSTGIAEDSRLSALLPAWTESPSTKAGSHRNALPLKEVSWVAALGSTDVTMMQQDDSVKTWIQIQHPLQSTARGG
ncbi:hypothetical protein Nepgr_002809 [Nepenthes gracilis]|uniref:Uncharacterized protein n=1 Tax=Nepenthes gracilis TaxID=150966 RepID=A0AAD3P8E6_NEPGR|nr:hypothetical protein Nepgr_002809 [Nepenthes gracilis]